MFDQLRRDITTRLEDLVGEADKLRRALTALAPGQRKGTTATASPSTSAQTPRQARTSSRATVDRKRASGTGKPTAPARSTAPRSRPAKTKAAAPSARSAPGQTKTAVLAALAGGEAMTASEVATSTGLAAPTVSTTLSRLAKAGEITKADRGYQTNPSIFRAMAKNAGTSTGTPK